MKPPNQVFLTKHHQYRLEMNRSNIKPQSISSPEGCAGAELCPSKPQRAPEAGSSVYSETGVELDRGHALPLTHSGRVYWQWVTAKPADPNWYQVWVYFKLFWHLNQQCGSSHPQPGSCPNLLFGINWNWLHLSRLDNSQTMSVLKKIYP